MSGERPSKDPVLYVNPLDIDIPEIKARAATIGANVLSSKLVPRGQALLYRPEGLPVSPDGLDQLELIPQAPTRLHTRAFTESITLGTLEPDPYLKGMEGSARAAGKWSPAELAAVDEAILQIARDSETFTADEVWRRLGPGFPVTKGMAARLNAANRRGLIYATGDTRRSSRGGEHDHAQRLTVWRSHVHRREADA